MDFRLERPALYPTLENVIDQPRITIVHGNVRYLLQQNSRRERVTAADFSDTGAAAQHVGDESVM